MLDEANQFIFQIESAFPDTVTLASKLVSLVEGASLNNVVQVVGEAIAMVAQGVDLNAVNAYLNAATGGILDSLEAALGINNLTEVLGLAQ